MFSFVPFVLFVFKFLLKSLAHASVRDGTEWRMENGEWRLKNVEWKMEEWRKPGLGPIGSKKITRALGKCGFVSGQLSLTTDVHRISGTIAKFVVVITTVPILLSGLRLHVGYS